MTFEEFEDEWKQKGIKLKIKKITDKFEGEEIALFLTKSKDKDMLLMCKEKTGFVIEPNIFQSIWDCDLEDSKAISTDDFIIFLQLAKEFAELTKDIKLKANKDARISSKIF